MNWSDCGDGDGVGILLLRVYPVPVGRVYPKKNIYLFSFLSKGDEKKSDDTSMFIVCHSSFTGTPSHVCFDFHCLPSEIMRLVFPLFHRFGSNC